MRSCEKIGRKRPGQAKPPAPPLTQNDFHWWRRRFRLRILIFSQLLTVSLDSVFFPDGRLAGPDTAGNASIYEACVRGDLSLAQKVLDLKNDEAALQQYLETEAALQPRDDRALREMRGQATQFSGLLKRKGLEAAMRRASNLYNAAANAPAIHKIN